MTIGTTQVQSTPQPSPVSFGKAWDRVRSSFPYNTSVAMTIDSFLSTYLARHFPEGRITQSQLKEMYLRSQGHERYYFIRHLLEKTRPGNSECTVDGETYKLMPSFLLEELIDYFDDMILKGKVEEEIFKHGIPLKQVYKDCLKAQKEPHSKYRKQFLASIRQYQSALMERILTLTQSLLFINKNYQHSHGTSLKITKHDETIETLAKSWILWNDLRIFLEGEEIKDSITQLRELCQKPLAVALPVLATMNTLAIEDLIRSFLATEVKVELVQATLEGKKWEKVSQQFYLKVENLDFDKVAHFYDHCNKISRKTKTPKSVFTEDQKKEWNQIFESVKAEDIPLLLHQLRQLKKTRFDLFEKLSPYLTFIKRCHEIIVLEMIPNLNTFVSTDPKDLLSRVTPLPHSQLPEALDSLNVSSVAKMLEAMPLKLFEEASANEDKINRAMNFINTFDCDKLLKIIGRFDRDDLVRLIRSINKNPTTAIPIEFIITAMTLSLEVVNLLRVVKTLKEYGKIPREIIQKITKEKYDKLKELEENSEIPGIMEAKHEIALLYRT